MESKKTKLLFKDRKGILLKSFPSSYSHLQSLIIKYFNVDPSGLSITFTDTEKDECEILDQTTFEAALSEFSSRIIINLYFKDSNSIQSKNFLISAQRKSLKFFKPRSRKMAVFDIESETVAWINFPEGIIFKEYAAWVELPSGEIFYCGGGNPVPSNEVYMLNPYMQTYKILPNMSAARHSQGITYSNGSVYVMGGIKSVFNQASSIKDCEKFDILNEKWEKIYDMEIERGDTSAVAMNDSILIFGKGSKYLVQYNSSDFKLDLLEDNGGCMSIVDGNLYIFHASKVKVCNLSNRQIIEECSLPRKRSWWSHCPPIVHNQFIYFLWWEEPGWICRFDRETKEFKNIISL